IGQVRVAAGNLVTRQDVVTDAGLVRVNNIKISIGRIVGVKRQPQQPLLSPCFNDATDIQEGRGVKRCSFEDQDLSALLNDEEAGAVTGRMRGEYRLCQPAYDGFKSNVWRDRSLQADGRDVDYRADQECS